MSVSPTLGASRLPTAVRNGIRTLTRTPTDPQYGDRTTIAPMGVLASYAIQLLITLIVLLVAILVGGKFAGAVPTDNTFSTAMTTVTDTAGTAFEIFGVTLIVIPGVAAIALIVARLAGPGMGGGDRR